MIAGELISGGILAIACVFLVAYQVHRDQRITFLSWATVAVGALYGLGWPTIAYATQAGLNPAWQPVLLPGVDDHGYQAFLAAMLLAGIWSGWFVVQTIVGPTGKARQPVPFAIDATTLLVGAYALLLIAVLGELGYAAAYGGPTGLLQYAGQIRRGIIEIENPLSFMRPFGGLASLSALVFFGLLLSRDKLLPASLGILLALPVTAFVLYSRQGRLSIVIFLMTLVLAPVFRWTRPVVAVIALPLFAILSFGAVYLVSEVLGWRFTQGIAPFAARELSFVYASFIGHLSVEPTQYRWFYDLLVMPAGLLPLKLTLSWVQDIDPLTSTIVNGIRDNPNAGTVPTSLLTVGYLQAPVIGIPIVGITFGGILKLVDIVIQKIPQDGVRTVLSVSIGIKLAARDVAYGSPMSTARGFFSLIVGGLVLFACVRLLSTWNLKVWGGKSTPAS